MSRPPYRGLSLGLRVVSGLLAGGGVLMILSDKPLVLRVFLHPPASEVSTLLLALLKEMGGVMIMLGVMLSFAARDPATQRRHPGRAHCGSLHSCHHSAAVSQDARSRQPLSTVFDLGTIAGQASLAAVLFYARPRGTLAPQ
jgi:hypothetical protein